MNDQEFAAIYPTIENDALMAMLKVSRPTLQRRARLLGLRKSPEHMEKVQRARATGRKLSDESRRKIALKARGRRMSEETKAKIFQTKIQHGTLPKGEKHYKWKGGKTWKRFKDPRYQEWRTAVLKRDDYKCQDCGRQCKKYERGLAAHHIKEWAEYPEHRFEVSNGKTLCRQCHMLLHTKHVAPKEPVSCACGCGTMISPEDPYGRPRRFVNYHGKRGVKMSESSKLLLREQRQGKRLTPEHREKIVLGLRSSQHRIGRPPQK